MKTGMISSDSEVVGELPYLAVACGSFGKLLVAPAGLKHSRNQEFQVSSCTD